MKNTFYISCPIDTYSGYGARSRDFVKALIELDEYDIRILPQRWGSTPFGFIKEHKEKWGFLEKHITQQVSAQPDIWCQITVPNEFQNIGKFNIGLTAGIETDVCSHPWVQGMNKMDLILTSSVHSKNVLSQTEYSSQDQRTGQPGPKLKLNKPIEVIIEGADLETFKVVKNNKLKFKDLKDKLNSIPEKFAFLSVGHWMKGDLGHDRKNLGTLIKNFYTTFRGEGEKPALILKSSVAGCSYASRREVLRRINDIKEYLPQGQEFPSIYLINGEFTDDEMNELYNHHKIKAMVSLTHGEGFGRPLLEFSMTGKPILASGWSGQMDFLHKDYTALLHGEIRQVDKSVVWENVILENSKWFFPHENHTQYLLTDMINNYKVFKENAKKQKEYSIENFSFEVMKNQIKEVLSNNVPAFPKKLELNLSGLEQIKMPKKEKVNG